ncbi:uncharacterized protein LOC141854482 [Brevipalpus obovatus]|uniref:uncharacterized protein LOC141854482 n=1 Tax=Brevipalpus obovatus TaxID=246614 RepID=UPI003D9E2491
MGFDLDRFRAPVSSVVLCTICQNVLDDPVQSYHCKHVYCRKCITPLLTASTSSTGEDHGVGGGGGGGNSGPQCPKCKKSVHSSDLEVPKTVKNFLQNLEIKCDFAANGCSCYIKMEDLIRHRDACVFNPENSITCPNNCGAVMKRRETETHCCLSYLQSIISERDAYIDEVIEEGRETRHENRKLRSINSKLKDELDKCKEEIRKLKLELEFKKGITSLLKFDLLYSQSKAVSEEHRNCVKELRTKGMITSNKVFEVMILVDINNFTVKESNTRNAKLRRFVRVLEMLCPLIHPDWKILTSNALYISVCLSLMLGTNGQVVALTNNFDLKLRTEKYYGFLVTANKLEIIFDQCWKNGYSQSAPYDCIIGIFPKTVVNQLKDGGCFYDHTTFAKKMPNGSLETIQIT